MDSSQAVNVVPLEKAPTGIDGFDEITCGGLPRGRTTLLMGGPGSGKTVFALQSVVNAAQRWGEPSIFVACEENAAQVRTNAATFGWDLPELEKDRLFFLNGRPPADVIVGGAFTLEGTLSMLRAKVAEMGARRIVFDSLDVLLTLMPDPLLARQELYRIRDWLAETGLTGVVTVRGDLDQPLASQESGFVQFIADCVVLLQHRLVDRVSLRELRVSKYRGSGFVENEVPYLITERGIEVGSLGASEAGYTVFQERVSSGVERLDTMLRGGYYRGTSVLITGAPGTAKSTLVSAFARAACGRGERTLYVALDEEAPEIVRNMASVGIDLAPCLESGRLHIAAIKSEARSAEGHLLTVRRLIRDLEPACLVIDPLSAMLKSGGAMPALSVAQRLLYMTKERGITALCTSLVESGAPELEGARLRVSTIADVWIHLSYLVQGGERNRALTIVKARGTGHSNQVRELTLSPDGVDLADVYTVGGDVLMGTLRWEKETRARLEEERAQAAVEQKRHELELARAEAQARLAAAEREIEARKAELALLEKEEALRRVQDTEVERSLAGLRRSDAPEPEGGEP